MFTVRVPGGEWTSFGAAGGGRAGCWLARGQGGPAPRRADGGSGRIVVSASWHCLASPPLAVAHSRSGATKAGLAVSRAGGREQAPAPAGPEQPVSSRDVSRRGGGGDVSPAFTLYARRDRGGPSSGQKPGRHLPLVVSARVNPEGSDINPRAFHLRWSPRFRYQHTTRRGAMSAPLTKRPLSRKDRPRDKTLAKRNQIDRSACLDALFKSGEENQANHVHLQATSRPDRTPVPRPACKSNGQGPVAPSFWEATGERSPLCSPGAARSNTPKAQGFGNDTFRPAP